MQIILYNARLVLADEVIERGWLRVEDGHIDKIGSGNRAWTGDETRYIDAGGDLVMPGIIDLHCDAIERHVEPRPTVQFELPLALNEADYRLASCGITTEYHGIFVDDNEFGLRSDRFLLDFATALQEMQDPLVRHKSHARLELSSTKGYQTLLTLIEERKVDLVSMMDHSPGQGQYVNEEAYYQYMARTTHRSREEVDAYLALKRAQAATMPQRIEQVTTLARKRHIAIATHDDDTAQKVEQWPALGVSISEFPTTWEAARRAHELGLAVCMGAPNVVRGRSTSGNLNATTAIEAGIVDILCSDYYPVGMLSAVFTLVQKKLLTLPEATRLVTLNPARAVGMGKVSGELAVGKIADIIQVRLNAQHIPIVQRIIVGGQERLVRG